MKASVDVERGRVVIEDPEMAEHIQRIAAHICTVPPDRLTWRARYMDDSVHGYVQDLTNDLRKTLVSRVAIAVDEIDRKAEEG